MHCIKYLDYFLCLSAGAIVCVSPGELRWNKDGPDAVRQGGAWTEPGMWSQEAGTQTQPCYNLFCVTLCTSLSLGISFSVGKMKVCMALYHFCKRKLCVYVSFTCVKRDTPICSRGNLWGVEQAGGGLFHFV